MIVSLKKLLRDAEKHRYAIGAFNTSNLEVTQAIVRAAIRKKSPVIIQTTESAIEYAGAENLTAIVHTVAIHEGKKIPIVLHLDHGRKLATVKKVLQLGYNSVMLDASHLPFAENIRLTRQAAVAAHRYGASAQGEVGVLRGAEDWVRSKENFLTKPEEAVEFLARTGVDTLAVSIGTMHGVKKFALKGGVPKLDIDRLQKIRAAVGKVPIVLHGASGVSALQLRQAIRYGVRIVNIDTEIRLAFSSDLRNYLQKDQKAYDPRTILTHVRDAVQKTVEKKMDELGSSGRL